MTGSGIGPLASDLSGAGPLAVLVHGITEDRRSFDPLLPLLRPHYRVLTVDLRGHGESPAADSYRLDEMAADIAALVEQVGGDGARAGTAPLVVGHSLGGAVAAAYATRYPVRGVVNIDQSLDLAAMQARLAAVADLLRGDAFHTVIAGMFEELAGPLPDGERRRLDGIRRPVQQVVLGVWSPLLELTSDQLVAAVDDLITPPGRYPYLQVQGTAAGAGYPDWLRARIPGAKLDTWVGAGHYPHLREPERFVALVRAFEPAV